MVDLKLYPPPSKNNDDLQGLQSIMKRFSNGIELQFGLDKCAKITFRKVSSVKSEDIILDMNTEIIQLKHHNNKYSRIIQRNGNNTMSFFKF